MGTVRESQESQFTTADGTELYYRHWPAVAHAKGAIVLFHRGHEHSGRMEHLVDELDLPDYHFFAWDARGHGHSPGERGFSPSFATSVADVDNFIDHIESQHTITKADIAVVAQSVGAALISTWVHDYAPKIRAMVLASPAFKVKLYVPFARTLIKLKEKISGRFFVNSYVKARFLTHDPERIVSFENDPLITRPIASHILLGLYEAAERVVADAAAITVPTQLLISGADWVVHHKPQHDFYNRLGASTKERHVLDGFYHDTLGEKDRAQAVEKIRTFLLARFAEAPNYPNLCDADKLGVTRYEADKLATPYPALSPFGLYWQSVRLGLYFGQHLSEGVKLGQQTGFDSGSTLDYVYRNQPSGRGKLGEFVDKQYLTSIGWRGIRQRKINVETLLGLAMERLREAQKPIHIFDTAAGHGRYILEALESQQQTADSILLRDFSELNVEQGNALIRHKGLENSARFIQGDAFDTNSYQHLDNPITLGVVSGLYELFPDNDLIRRSLAGFAEAIEDGGYLIYTGQPWHPQLEFIARALTSHRQGQAWVMRRRTQAEMDQLVEAAGFKKITQRIDEYGIFTVSLAVKV